MVENSRSGGRYVGAWPRIGIRPAIDGRRNGVRESLEGQTMGLARTAAAFACDGEAAARARGPARHQASFSLIRADLPDRLRK